MIGKREEARKKFHLGAFFLKQKKKNVRGELGRELDEKGGEGRVPDPNSTPIFWKKNYFISPPLDIFFHISHWGFFFFSLPNFFF